MTIKRISGKSQGRCRAVVNDGLVYAVLKQPRATQRRIPRGREDEERLVGDMIELAPPVWALWLSPCCGITS